MKKYIIYEDAIVEPKIQSNDGGNKRKYEDDIEFVCNGEKRKCIRSTWPEEKRFLAMKPIFESVSIILYSIVGTNLIVYL